MGDVKKIKHIVIIIIVLITLYLIFNHYRYKRLINQPVTVCITTRIVDIGDFDHVEYKYLVEGKMYTGDYLLGNNNIEIPKGKYLLIFNENRPKIHAPLFERKADSLEYGKSYYLIVPKNEIKTSLKKITTSMW